jgi:small subunit ribosomal protein S6
MRSYEVVVIFDATLEEEAIRPVLDRATAPITRDGSQVTFDRWGKRRFAYELKHRWEGIYVLLAFNTESTAAVAELDRVLYLADEVLRHKVMRIPDKVAGKARPTRPAETPPEAAPATTGAES